MSTTVKIVHVDGDEKFDMGVEVGDVALAKVLSSFSPSHDPRVTILKTLSAALITMMLDQISSVHIDEPDANVRGARQRAAHIAITQMEIAQMCLVKALFAKA